jgi:mRNA interferase RelE/StbE
MSAIWKIKIHKLVLNQDFKSISRPQQGIILKGVHKKLSLDPKGYGKPLSGNLKGYWRLKVGDYRVIYRVIEDIVTVFVIKVGVRRDEEVYIKMLNRLKRLHTGPEVNTISL